MKILLYYLRDFRRQIFFALLLAALGQICLLIEPIILRYAIDHWALVPDQLSNGENTRRILLILAALLSFFTISKLLKLLEEHRTNVISQGMGMRFYSNGLAHALTLPYAKLQEERIGAILYRLQKTKGDVEQVIQMSLGTVVGMLVSFVFVLIYSISVSWIIAAAAGLGFLLIAVLSIVLSNKMREMQENLLRRKEILSADTVESLRNIEVIKCLGLVPQEIKRLGHANEALVLLELDRVKRLRLYSFAQGTILNLARVSAFGLVLYFVYIREITLGEFFSLYLYAFMLLVPFKKVGQVTTLFSEANISLEAFEKLIQSPAEPRTSVKLALGELTKIEFRGTDFRYNGREDRTIRKVSCVMKRGETVAFVGATGAGKSTLVKLLVGLYNPSAGEILYNDRSITDLDLDDIRRQIGLVPQESLLFGGTIRENLSFVSPSSTDQECLNALKESDCLSFMERSNLDLNSLIGEAGSKLSGGERQRIAIARALLRQPRLLIFDEATSSLDSQSELAILSTIKTISQSNSRITVIISHRLSAVRHADRINVLENGQIVEAGNHSELLEKRGLYFAMWRQQHSAGLSRPSNIELAKVA